MRLIYTFLFSLFTFVSIAQNRVGNLIGPFPPTPGIVADPNGQPCLEKGIHTALPFMGFGNSCFEQVLNQIRVVAPDREAIINSDQNPALLHQPTPYQAVNIAYTPWQTGRDFNAYSHALKVSIQKQFRKGASLSFRYENFTLQPFLNHSRIFLSTIPSNGTLYRLAFAKPLSEHWSFGLAAKYARRQPGSNPFFFDLIPTQAVAADLGFRYQNSKPLSDWQKLNWQWGFSLTNLGAKVHHEIPGNTKQPLPTALSIGFMLEEEFRLAPNSTFRIRGAYQFNKLLVPSTCVGCDEDGNGILDYQEYSALGGMLVSFVDSPAGLRGEWNEINHQFDMSISYNPSARFGIRAKATLFYQHPDQGALQYLSVQLGMRWRSIHFDCTYWRPNDITTLLTTQRSLSLSLGYQHFFSAS